VRNALASDFGFRPSFGLRISALGFLILLLSAPLPLLQAQPASPTNHVLELDGTGGYVELPSNIFSSLTEATVEGWVRWKSLRQFSRFFDFGSIWAAMDVCNDGTSDSLHFGLGRPPFTQSSE